MTFLAQPFLAGMPGWRIARLSRGAISLVGLVMLMAVRLYADDITFLDGTDSVSVSSSSSRILFSSCLLEVCSVTLSGPANASTFSVGGSGVSFAAEIAEPGSIKISDEIDVNPNLPDLTKVFVDFFSDHENRGIPCNVVGGCQLTEDGTVQTAVQITWLDNTGAVVAVDNIKFQSDVAVTPVPEPASVLLLLTGFAGLGISRLRHRVARQSPSVS
jgi:hypothetical protein